VVTLTPVPNSGYKFDNWSGTDSGYIIDTAGIYTIVMNGDKSATANFVLIPQYTLTTSGLANGRGSIVLDPSGVTYTRGHRGNSGLQRQIPVFPLVNGRVI
jgi:hypothetical protein